MKECKKKIDMMDMFQILMVRMEENTKKKLENLEEKLRK